MDEEFGQAIEEVEEEVTQGRRKRERRVRKVRLRDGKLDRIWVPKLHTHEQILDYCALTIRLVERELITPEQAQAIESLLARAQDVLKDRHLTAELVRKARQIVEEE